MTLSQAWRSGDREVINKLAEVEAEAQRAPAARQPCARYQSEASIG